MNNIKKENLLPSEAIYEFCGWLTSRREVTTMSGAHDAGVIADLINDFIVRKGLDEPREEWTRGGI